MTSDSEERCPKCGGVLEMTGSVNRSSSASEYVWGRCQNCREEIIIALTSTDVEANEDEIRDDLIL